VATIDMGRKEGEAVVPLSRKGAGSPSNTMWPGPRSTSVPIGIFIHPAVGHNRHGPKTGGCAPLGEGEAGFQSKTMSPGLRPTSVRSGILTHPAVWPQ